MANKALGLSETPDGFVWHHVPKDIHNAIRHTVVRQLFAIKDDRRDRQGPNGPLDRAAVVAAFEEQAGAKLSSDFRRGGTDDARSREGTAWCATVVSTVAATQAGLRHRRACRGERLRGGCREPLRPQSEKTTAETAVAPWSPADKLSTSAEQCHPAEAAAAGARKAESAATKAGRAAQTCFIPQSTWGHARLVKELRNADFSPPRATTSGGGKLYTHPNGTEIRIMPRPNRAPWPNEPAAKFQGPYYYRMRTGPDQPWGPHQSIPTP